MPLFFSSRCNYDIFDSSLLLHYVFLPSLIISSSVELESKLIVCFIFVWRPCMAINVSLQYNGGFLLDILLLTQAPICIWFDGTIIVYYDYPFNNVLHCFVFDVLMVSLHGD